MQPINFSYSKRKKRKIPGWQRRKEAQLKQALIEAVGDGNDAEVSKLLDEGANPNVRLENGNILHLAAQLGKDKICELLVQHGAIINRRAPYTPLMHTQDEATAEVLLKYGADVHAQVNLPNGYQTNYLFSALANNFSPRHISLLLSYGIDVSLYNKNIFKYTNAWQMPLLIEESRFYPIYTDQKLQAAQRLTRARIWVLKKMAPRMPKDIVQLILAQHRKTWYEACCTPLRIHTNMHDNRIFKMPLPVLRTLIAHKAVNPNIIVSMLLKYKISLLTPLMKDALSQIADPNLKKMALENPRLLLELHFSDAMKATLQSDLGIKNRGCCCSIQ